MWHLLGTLSQSRFSQWALFQEWRSVDEMIPMCIPPFDDPSAGAEVGRPFANGSNGPKETPKLRWVLVWHPRGETEVACTLALLQDLIERLGRRFFDVLVADALYLQKPFLEAVEALGLDWVMNLKENQPELLAEAQRATAGPASYRHVDSRQELELWHAPEADRAVRIVKTVRLLKKNRLRVPEPGEKKHLQESLVEPSTNFYASNFILGAIPPLRRPA